MFGADPSGRMGLMGKRRWTEIDPDYLPEDGRAKHAAWLAAWEAAREAEKQYEAEMRARGLVREEKIGIEKNGGKAPCSNCLRTTSHKILHSEERELDQVFQLIECAGCGRISMAHFYLVSGDEHWADYYPSPVSRPQP